MSRPFPALVTGCPQCAALREELDETRAKLVLVRAENAHLLADRSRLRAENARLLEELRANSGNSSKPPSSDPTSRPRHTRTGKAKTSRRRRGQGAQPGHPATNRAMVANPDRVHDVDPAHCELCGGSHLERTEREPLRHQVVDVPAQRAEVDEFRRFEAVCLDCRHHTLADLPDSVPTGGFGPVLQATTTYLTGPLRLSRRATSRAIEDIFGVHMSAGSVCAIEAAATVLLDQPVQEAHRAATAAPVACIDETGWRHHNHKAWLWVFHTSVATIFQLATSRGHDAFEAIVGTFEGILVSDRWVVYDRWDVSKRQLCWAHLQRTWELFIERGGATAEIGRTLLDATQKMFHWWHKVRDGSMTREHFRRHMGPLRSVVQDALARGMALRSPARTRRTCERVRKLDTALWTFIDHEGVEPTNNAGEQAIRHGVLWRKTSLGTQSAQGKLYAERIMTATATVRQHGRNIYAYLVELMNSRLHGRPPPSLLCDSDGVETLKTPW